MYWKFRRIAPDEVETEITQRDQFRNDDVDLSDTVVRESVQNSLDACNDNDQVKVRFQFVREETGLDKHFFDELFDGQLEHARKAGLEVDSVLEESAEALVIEDFGTTGLTGAIDVRDDDNFSDFWRRHGKSHKTGKSGGRWGLGKIVYSYSSRVGAFFGLTHRHGDSHSHLMGQTVLNTHVIGDDHYAPHGFFAHAKEYEPQQGLQVPINDPVLRQAMVENCDLQRSDKSGLSIVIPYPQAELEAQKMTAVSVENYFFPILTNELVLEIDGTLIDRTTLRRVAMDFSEGRIDDAEKLFDFVEETHEMRQAHLAGESEMLVLDTDWYKDWKLDEQDFEEAELLEDLRERFARHELIGVGLRVELRRRDGTREDTSVELFLKTDPDITRGRDLYVRGGITVPGEAKFKHRKAFGALVAKDGPISEFLGDAENAAHTKWNGRAEKLTAKYMYGPQTLSAIRNSLVQLHDLLGQAVEEEAEDALLDFFWAPGDAGPTKKRKRKSPPRPDIPPLERKPKPIQVDSTSGGFKIHPSPDAKPDQFPLRCRAVVAYDVPSGDPFKRWQKFDFELGKSKGLPINGHGVKLESLVGNTMEMLIDGPDFLLGVNGFDSERDIVVRVSTSEV